MGMTPKTRSFSLVVLLNVSQKTGDFVLSVTFLWHGSWKKKMTHETTFNTSSYNGQRKYRPLRHSIHLRIRVIIMHFCWFMCHFCVWMLNGDNQLSDRKAVKGLQSATDLNTFHYSTFNKANLTDPARNLGSLFF